jgi:hypothetical protein
MEVVRRLCEDSSPIYGVDGTEVEGLVDFRVCKECFDGVLYRG